MTNTNDTPTVKIACSVCWGFGLSRITGMPITQREAKTAQLNTPVKDLDKWYLRCEDCGAFVVDAKPVTVEAVEMTTLKSGFTFDSRILEQGMIDFKREQPDSAVRPGAFYSYTINAHMPDGSTLTAPGLQADDMKEFYELWQARRRLIKASRK